MFITLEGVDGAGKSLQAKKIAERLAQTGREIVSTREPGGSKGAEELRALVLNGETDRWSAMSEILIFTAARRDHCERVIWPALKRGAIVICDRFADSTRLYQGLESEEHAKAVDAIHDIAIHTEPDLTLIFDMSPERAFARMEGRGEADMRFEGHGLDFQHKRRAGFQALLAKYPKRCVLIDADQEIEEVTMSAMNAILKRL